MGSLICIALVILLPPGCGKGDIDPGILPGELPTGKMEQGPIEICDGQDNNMDGQIDEDLEGCTNIGGESNGGNSAGQAQAGGVPFPLSAEEDPRVMETDGVGLDENGDLVLNRSASDINFMWIANSKDDGERGTISKIDTRTMKEVGRYYTVTCHSRGLGAGCVDINGRPVAKGSAHSPSRTAVDFNFDVWVANRAMKGQPSVTKIANDHLDCIDRNGNGQIDTSRDLNGDGKITLGTNEFIGDADECVIFTVNFDEVGSIGRSVCLQPQKGFTASNAWVATYNKEVNNFYRVDGKTGALSGPYPLPTPHRVYGCAVDSQGILWSVNRNNPEGTLVALNTRNPVEVSPVMTAPWEPSLFYGIAVGLDDHIWIGGQFSGRTYRYRPDRTSFATLSQGSWTGIEEPPGLGATRGIAPDNRGWVWVAGNNGFIWRIDQNIGEGLQPGSPDIWQVTGSQISGVGVDFDGHLWAISSEANGLSRLEVDGLGAPLLPVGSQTTDFVSVGETPYTYSDFTGYGLKSFTKPMGRYRVQLEPCAAGEKANWAQVTWSATTPPGTSVSLRVRAGNSATTFGQWHGPYLSSPAILDLTAASPLVPNPASMFQLEFILENSGDTYTPTLHDFQVAYSCDAAVE